MHSQSHPSDPTRRRFGGPQPNSGPKRQKRASEVAAERIARQGNLMADAIIDAMRPGKPDSIRLQGARQAMELEHREAELRRKEESELDGLTDSALVDMLVEMGSRMAASGMVGRLSPSYD